MNNPVSTYRLQFHKAFTFQDFEYLIPYFRKLGVGTIYASPVLAATTGSTHGYDGIDPGKINPEIGTLDQLHDLTARLRESGIGWLQDIVPNHMAFHPENPWLMDVLEKGRQSVFAGYFDIAWNSALFQGKLMAPFLSREPGEMIDAGEVKVLFDGNRFALDFGGQVFPLNLRSYISLFQNIGEKSQAITQLLDQLEEMNRIEDAPAFSQAWDEWIMQLRALYAHEQEKRSLDAALAAINEDPAMLKVLLEQQNYVPCHWQRTEEQINYRRFFTVNGLICLNIQDDTVFGKYHALIRQLTEEGVFQGIRIDHIDGLFDPSAYLSKLRAQAGSDSYIIAEKILGEDEELPASWPIQGTTGYEFLAVVNNLFTNSSAEEAFTAFYSELNTDSQSVREQLLGKKSEMLYGHMAGELENLYQLFVSLELADQETLDRLGAEVVRQVIGEFLIHCPVYRYYGNAMPLSDEEAQAVKDILIDINKHHLDLSPAVEVLEQCFIHRTASGDEDYNRRAAQFYQRCMQFTGPLMAKGGEDTLMYTYNRFIAHNDVGDFPDRFGMSVADFHQFMKKRRKEWPMALSATSTHDTKRGEDVRARLNVLTDLADEWIENVNEWRVANNGLRKSGQGPDANDEYLIYQTIVGAYPMPGEDPDDFEERLEDYLQKALREAKTNSNWASPNEAYEQETKGFAAEILKRDSAFTTSFQAFLESIADFGIINSLAQLALKFTCPGIPDVYQGCELWDLSLVDPDNRRKVDFGKRTEWLDEMESYEPGRLQGKLWEDRRSGQIKLWLTQQLFGLRRQNPVLFTQGEYIPLKVRGTYKDHLLAFIRRYKRDVFLTVVPLHTAILCRKQQLDFFNIDWQDTHVVLPESLRPEWNNLLTGSDEVFELKLAPAELFKGMPVAILQGKRVENDRNAGVLLHITSLASPFGIGDIGPAAYQFADFLEKTSQKVWQILPLNPTDASQGNSPYSALSSRAGNPLLISPEMLAGEGYLTREDLEENHLPDSPTVDFNAAGERKKVLLERAFQNYKELHGETSAEFDAFAKGHASWLDDFALYMVLKKRFDNQPWYTWPEEFRNREQAALDKLREEDREQILRVEWQQYVFDSQWKNLRQYCNDREIKLLGDIPFYVSHDSADVWANRELFCVDEDGRITGIAGVPPDAFSEDGQLWGMPVFNWNALQSQGYQWWIDRLARNIELFDLVRLDHFRAFANYWQVPGGEKTAVRGEWKTGPVEDFFRAVEAALGQLPFIAEDLGEIGPEVYSLRDKFKLPGMKVLQFAFDENMSQSDHIPHHYKHNFIAYTGTHDNNTTKGWYRELVPAGIRERLETYLGKPVSEENVAAELAKAVFASVAKTAILPMQDILNLDETTKMNLPGSNGNNWSWRLMPGQITDAAAEFLTSITLLYNRE
ncbi:4-alpha-glucanotransferase/malto-oligosyltrehalose synthase,TIGR02401 [Dyadobacter sp. SG02]|uniref:malto-oligosyltrehalose synthase n=1 Tax=Dyadobacter sp. SG02 TaxID=1855291 RepID=UPI0008D102C6|nr:malto-oligosyltrehalose synthase [Dyadobacter sp. SG02]SEJ81674.1 4-alpha-glucanotransferase/malto-oligosyltrehalose synthase,TIGR02401 [Dyadobacter sp. SG02]